MISSGELLHSALDSRGSALPICPSLRIAKTVLIVDDDPITLLLGANILKKSGCISLRAAGPSQAIALFEQYGLAIDLLVTDVNMPGMNGYELGERLRRRNPRLPVLCMSAGSVEDALPTGFSFIEKPFTFGGFIQGVVSALDPSSDARFIGNSIHIQKKGYLNANYRRF